MRLLEIIPYRTEERGGGCLPVVLNFTSDILVTNLDFKNITIKKFLGLITQSKADGLSTASDWHFGLIKPGMIYSIHR